VSAAAQPFDGLRAAIVAACPELAAASFVLLGEGWDCAAVEVDGRLVVKLPRHAEAALRLGVEARVLAAVRPYLAMAVPDMALRAGPPLVSCHRKIPGEQLLERHYGRLQPAARDRLAGDLALFFAECQTLPVEMLRAAGAVAVAPWPDAHALLARAWPHLPPELRGDAERVVAAWDALAPDPHGTAWGHFDTHGWNMAFDHEREVLNGIYDFGDAGFGPLHRAFVYPGWIAPDLSMRVASAYERLTGRALDRGRIHLLGSVLRLAELPDMAGDAELESAMLRQIARWAQARPRAGA